MPAFGSVYTVIRSLHPHPELPLDLYRPVLEHLRGDQRALCRLALVNRNMYSEAMVLLYERVELSTTAKIRLFVDGVLQRPDAARRIHSLVLNLDVALHTSAHRALVTLLSMLSELTELHVSLRNVTANVAHYGAMLLECPSDKLVSFEWDCMYSAPVRDFISRQHHLEELTLTDGSMVVGRHDEFSVDRLTRLRRVAGDARWITQIARGRPIESVTVTRTSFSASTGVCANIAVAKG